MILGKDRCTPQGNIELMPKKEILKLKSAPRLEQVGDNCPKQMEHRNHRVPLPTR